MGEKGNDRRSAAQRAAAALRYLILSEQLTPGDRLPSTAQLMEQYDITNATVQRATEILKGEGLLRSEAGRGVFVRDRSYQTIRPADYLAPSADGEPYAWIGQAQRRGQSASNRLITVEEVTAPRRVARSLHLPPGATVWMRRRLGLINDEPAEVSTSYYAPDLAAGTPLTTRRRIPGGSPTLLAEMGRPIRAQLDQLTPRPATTWEYELLQLPGDIPCQEIYSVAYTDFECQRPVEVTEVVKPGHLFRMEYKITVPSD